MKDTRYKIVTGMTLEALELHVNQCIMGGYQPAGGVVMCGNVLIQAMCSIPDIAPMSQSGSSKSVSKNIK